MQMTLETSPKELVDQCARCHMRRQMITDRFNFEGTMLDHYYPQLIAKPTYYADGQILDEDYVYGSFVQSKMYHENVTCTNCHDAHTLERKFEGNKLCAQCHVPEKYDTEEHSFHKLGTEGALCINCHMPGKFYMGNDFRRDHSFRIPRPDLSVKHGTPNACVGCHTNKTDQWAADVLLKLKGAPKENHFSDLLIPGLNGEPNAHASLLKLAKDSIYPEIARASAIKELPNYRDQALVKKQLLEFLNDDSPLVRASSVDALNEISDPAYIKHLLPLLEDEKRAVRLKAFGALAIMDEKNIPQKYKAPFEKVKKEYFIYLDGVSDFVGGRINRANYILKKGDLQGAIKGYESLLYLLAYHYANNNQKEKAKNIALQLVELFPNNSQYFTFLQQLN